MRTKFLVTLALCSLLLGGVAAAQPAGTPEKLVVGSLKIANLTPLYIAEKLGYFREEGLQVDTKFMGGGAELLTILAAHKVDIIYSNYTSFLEARAAGYPFVIVAGHAAAPLTPPTGLGLFAKQGGPVRTLKDLEGKTVAVNDLKNLTWLTAVVTLEKHGVDAKRVNFREVPWPAMPDALLRNQVDAVVLPEPFSLFLQQKVKVRLLAYPYIETQPGLPLAGWIADEGWARKHPGAVSKFVRAVRRGIDLINRSGSERIKYLEEFTRMKPALARKILLDRLDTKVDVSGLQRYADLMVHYGLLRSRLDVSKVVFHPAR